MLCHKHSTRVSDFVETDGRKASRNWLKGQDSCLPEESTQFFAQGRKGKIMLRRWREGKLKKLSK